jgi:hypothetical protein
LRSRDGEQREEAEKMSASVKRRLARARAGLGACVLGVLLLAGGCAGDGSMSVGPNDRFDPDGMFDDYDDDGDGTLGPAEWDQFHIDLDGDGDGSVSREEFDAWLDGGDGD